MSEDLSPFPDHAPGTESLQPSTTAVRTNIRPYNPLKNVSPEYVLQRYLNEETSTQIAQSLGVTKAALSYHMLKHAEQQWKDAQVVKAIKRKEEAEDLMESADNNLDLARAREILRGAQWDLERVCRRIYGQDVQTALAAVQVNISLRRGTAAHSVEIEAERVGSSDESST